MKKHLAAALGLAFLLFIAIPGLADSIPKAFSFQTINFAGDPFTQLLGVNNSTAVVGYHNAVINEGFSFTLPNNFFLESVPNSRATQVIGLAFPGSTFTQALGVNDEGEAVGFYVDSAGATHGLVYENGVYKSVDDPFGIGMTTINGINDKGQIVGFYGPGGTMDNGFLGSPTPESASLLLVGTGLLGLALVLRRRKQASGAR